MLLVRFLSREEAKNKFGADPGHGLLDTALYLGGRDPVHHGFVRTSMGRAILMLAKKSP